MLHIYFIKTTQKSRQSTFKTENIIKNIVQLSIFKSARLDKLHTKLN